MIKIKNFLLVVISICLFISLFFIKDIILDKIFDYFEPEHQVIIEPKNNYYRNNEYLFVKQLEKEEDYTPHNYNDIINIYYSVLNQGWLEFTFYCPLDTYYDCLDDTKKISDDKILLSDISNYIHPYNSYSTIKTILDPSGEITIYVNRLYSPQEIARLNNDIDALMNNLLNDSMTLREKIKVLHDYIVNNTTYDTIRANENDSPYDSKRMTGTLYEHYAICSGYTDLMAVMLEKLNVPNYKIASDSHVWNAVYIDNTWLHLDLTWDDPINSNGIETYDDSYFLVTTEELKELDSETTDHTFDSARYPEFK